jgi:U32 family peptidase
MEVTSDENSPRVPELLAPAGNWDCARAAVEAGADAIYFGLDSFNARMRADNFTTAELPELMSFLHSRSVKGYLTLNTLIFEGELAAAHELLREVIGAGVDAAIVQDVGVCRLIRGLSVDFPIHASTQMTVTSAAGIRFAEGLGCHLVVMARECSIPELEKIDAEISEPGRNSVKMPLEVFVHGALCVAYSGQCLTSESLGGRSANRGECAQACRMTYDLYQDGERLDLGDRRYLLSPQDLMGLESIPDLITAGIQSFKIEGRLKTPEYVANVTSAYRRAIDASFQDNKQTLGEGAKQAVEEIADESRYDLEMAFSRGLYSGWLNGIENQKLVHARFGKKRGVLVGRVAHVGQRTLIIKAEESAGLKEGDGLVIDQGRPDKPEQGGRVQRLNPVKSQGKRSQIDHSQLEIGFRPGTLDFARVQTGDRVWKTSDLEFERRWQRVAKAQTPQYRRGLKFRVSGRVGVPMRVEAVDDQENTVFAESTMLMEAAQARPLNDELLNQQLGRLGGTPFDLKQIENELSGDVMLPISELNRLRRQIVDDLASLRRQRPAWHLASETTVPKLDRDQADRGVGSELDFVVLIRNLEQLESVFNEGIRTVYCDFEDPKKYRNAVEQYRERFGDHRSVESTSLAEMPGIFVAPPRIHKSGEGWILEQVRSCEPDGFLVRNYDHLEFFKGARLRADFSFNVANSLTAGYLMDQFALERLTPSYDLNASQLEALLLGAPPHWFEITLHQHMPMFHMEHCVFCAFMSEGKDYRDCGRPCDKHEVELLDRVGQRHALKADVGCRNTVFNGRAQTGAEFFGKFVELGVTSFRLEFLNESPSEVKQTIQSYDRLRQGEISGEALWRKLKLTSQLGVTRGTMGG